MSFAQKQYDSETQDVARIARETRKNHPELSWSECIRLAEKWVAERKA